MAENKLRKFNFYDYDSKYVMHCDSEAEARVFATHLHSIGQRWSSGDSYEVNTKWSDERGGTCYRFRIGVKGQLDNYTGWEGTTILRFADFDWEGFKETEEELKMMSYEEVMIFSPDVGGSL